MVKKTWAIAKIKHIMQLRNVQGFEKNAQAAKEIGAWMMTDKETIVAQGLEIKMLWEGK